MPTWLRALTGKVLRLVGPIVLLSIVTATEASAQEGQQQVIGTKRGKVYHIYPDDCASARRIRLDHRVVFESEEAARRAGRRLCRRCEQLREKYLEAAQTASRDDDSGQRTKPEYDDPHRPESGGRDDQRDDGRSSTPPASAAPMYATVKSVGPDGTIELDIGEKVCLAGVVCPPDGRPLAEDAVRFIIEQSRGRRVRVTLPAPLEAPGSRDVFGRLRAYLVPDDGGRDLGGELIFQGYAWVCRDRPCDRHAEYTRREEEAWRAQRGIWKPLDGEAGRQEVVTGRHARYYFAPDSPHAARLNGAFSLTVNEAKSRRLPPYPEYDCGSADRLSGQKARSKETSTHETRETQSSAAQGRSTF